MNEIKAKEGEITCIVPQSIMEAILDNQQRILALLDKVPPKVPENKSPVQATAPVIETEYLTQRQVLKILNRKPTWFWNMRNKGELPYAIVGRKIYYRREDILKLHERISQNKLIDVSKLNFITKKAT